jgi:integrase
LSATVAAHPSTDAEAREEGGVVPRSDAEGRVREIVDRLARALRRVMDHGVDCVDCEDCAGKLTQGGQLCGAGIELWARVAEVLKAYEDAVSRTSTDEGREPDGQDHQAHLEQHGAARRKVKHVAYGYTLMVHGKQERKVSSAWLTEAEALEALAKRQREVGAGILERAERTLGEVAEEYLRYKADHGKRTVPSDRRILERPTLTGARGRTRPPHAHGTGDRAVREDAHAAPAKGRGRTVSAYTVANELAVLRHLLRLAKRWGYVETVPEIVLPKRPAGRLRYLEGPELARLLDACRASRNPYLATIVLLAVHTGMRKGEILGLEWERVDLSSSRLTLLQTKNGKPRGVPINRAVYEALIALAPQAVQRTGLLFRRGNGVAWGQIRRAFESAVTTAGLTGFRFHDLRHTAASHLVMSGASLQEVKELLGHADLSMTLRYAHLSPAHLRGAVERLEGLTNGSSQHMNQHIDRPSLDASPVTAENS